MNDKPNDWAEAAYPGDPLAHLRWWCDTSERAAAELAGVLAELEEAKAVTRTLVTLFPDLPELLGGRHKQPAFELMVDAKRVAEKNGGNQ